MLRGEGIATIRLWESIAVVKRHVERSHVRLQEHVRHNHLVLQFGMLALVPRILIWAKIIPGPAVKTAFLHARDVVRHQIVAQLVALIYRGPQLASLRIRSQPDRVADAGGEHPLILTVRVERQNIRATLFALVIVSVRPRADGNIQGPSVRRELQVARPVSTAADALAT